MSKFKNNYKPTAELSEFNDFFKQFMEDRGGRYSCDGFSSYISDGSVGWEEGLEISEIHSYEKFYANTRDFYDFYLLLKGES